MLFCGDNVALCHTYTSYQLDTANDNPASGVYLPVEDTLVPATPLATPPPVWSSASPTTTGIYGLEDTTQASGATYACPSGGPTTGVNCVFVREYAQAYTFPGTRLTNGANHGVAYVVSPSTTGTYKFPTLTQTYAHGLQITGFDAVPGVSTSGTLNVTGTACPAAGGLRETWNRASGPSFAGRGRRGERAGGKGPSVRTLCTETRRDRPGSSRRV